MSLMLFEFAVILQPKLDKDGDELEAGRVVVEPQTCLAKNAQQATMLASREIDESHMGDLDRITLVVRPF